MDPVASPIQPIGVEDNKPQARFLYTLLQNYSAFWSKLLHRVNYTLPKDGTEEMTGPLELMTYTVATLPTASAYTGSVIYVSDGGPAFSGAQVKKTSAQSINNSAMTALVWHSEEYDEGGWFANSGDSIFTVPTGVTKVKLRAGVYWAGSAVGKRTLSIYKNGALFEGSPFEDMDALAAGTAMGISVATPTIACAAADTFSARAFQNSGGALNANNSTSTYFSATAADFSEGYGGTFQGSNGTRWVPLG